MPPTLVKVSVQVIEIRIGVNNVKITQGQLGGVPPLIQMPSSMSEIVEEWRGRRGAELPRGGFAGPTEVRHN